ncbi:MAG: polysaccharide deacetylase family protein [candidate division Zixibacteria bacterium]|nr:polysaccharide deacetylase family protein [candidate division Zixibacteria bacterium]
MSENKLFPELQILAFHKLSSKFTYGVTNYTPNRFEKLLQNLNKDFTFSSFNNLNEIENKRLIISFDDGYAHLKDALIPLIKKYNIKPIIFIPTAFIGKNNSWDYSYIFQNDPHLSVSEIRELSGLGVTFGSHGHSHNDLTCMEKSKIKEELKKSKTILEDITGEEVNTISYPFGRTSNLVCDMASELGYKYGVTMKFPDTNDNLLSIGRIPIYSYDMPFNIMQKINRGHLYKLEKSKASFTNFLSGGTVIFNKLFKRNIK